MFFNISEKLTSILIENGSIPKEDSELYSYGFRQSFTMLLNILTTLCVGLIFNELLQSIFFSISYLPIRSFAGGYHAKTPLRCYIYSTLMIILVLLLLRYTYITKLVNLILSLISVLVICILSPVQDNNKPLDELEKAVYKRRTMYLLFINFIISIIALFFHFENISYCFVLSLSSLGVILVLGMLKNKFVKNNLNI